MKKTAALVLAIILLLLCSCTSGSVSNKDGQTNGTNPILECKSYNENGYYYTDEVFPETWNLLYVDINSRQDIPVCAKPECTHDNETCASHFPYGVTHPFVLNNKLYYLARDTSSSGEKIFESDLDLSNRRIVATLPDNCENMLLYGMYSDGTDFYFMVNEVSEGGEYGVETSLTLLKVNIQNGTSKVLEQYMAGEPGHTIHSSYGRNLVLITSKIDNANNFYSVFEWYNVDTGESTELATIQEEKMGCEIDGQYLYENYYDDYKIVQTNLLDDTQKTYSYSKIMEENDLSEDPVLMFQALFEGYLYVGVSDSKTGESVFYEYLLNMETDKITPFTLRQSYTDNMVPAFAEFGDLFLVHRGFIVQPSGDAMQPLYIQYYSLITKTDYINSIPNYIPIESFRL